MNSTASPVQQDSAVHTLVNLTSQTLVMKVCPALRNSSNNQVLFYISIYVVTLQSLEFVLSGEGTEKVWKALLSNISRH